MVAALGSVGSLQTSTERSGGLTIKDRRGRAPLDPGDQSGATFAMSLTGRPPLATRYQRNKSAITFVLLSHAWLRHGRRKPASIDFSREKCV